MNNGVIFHVDEMSKWSHALKNVQNFLAATQETPWQIEVLGNSEAVLLYVAEKSDADFQLMVSLAAKGVAFVACQNALNAEHIAAESLPPFVTVVPAGVVELAKKQKQGYAYIKP